MEIQAKYHIIIYFELYIIISIIFLFNYSILFIYDNSK